MLKCIHMCLNHHNKVCRSLLLSKVNCKNSTFTSNYHYLSCKYDLSYSDLGYEPADLTVHPPPPKKKKRSRVDSLFSHRCLVPPKFFPPKKVEFVGDIHIRTHKNVVLRHNHSNPISTRLTLFDSIE